MFQLGRPNIDCLINMTRTTNVLFFDALSNGRKRSAAHESPFILAMSSTSGLAITAMRGHSAQWTVLSAICLENALTPPTHCYKYKHTRKHLHRRAQVRTSTETILVLANAKRERDDALRVSSSLTRRTDARARRPRDDHVGTSLTPPRGLISSCSKCVAEACRTRECGCECFSPEMRVGTRKLYPSVFPQIPVKIRV